MPPIDPLSSLAAAIRAQALALRANGAAPRNAAPRTAHAAAGRTSRPPQSGRGAVADAALLARVRALAPGPDDPRRAAFKLFLADVLGRAFGQALRADAGFDDWVEQVRARMEEDDDLRQAILAAGDQLLRLARSDPG